MLAYGLVAVALGAIYSSFKGRGHDMNTMEIGRRGVIQTIMFLGLEKPDVAFGYPPAIALVLYLGGCFSLVTSILLALVWPLGLIITTICLVVQSQTYGEAGEGITEQIAKRQDELLVWNDAAFKAKWRGKKIPIETANEAF